MLFLFNSMVVYNKELVGNTMFFTVGFIYV